METMSDTPKTDAKQKLKDMIGDEYVSVEFSRKLERERDEAREQRDNCQLELQIVTERLKGQHHPDDNGMKYEGEIDIKAITEQRDRLAEALQNIIRIYENPAKNCIPCSSDMYDEALQSLTTTKQ
jgi:hypothetical protein